MSAFDETNMTYFVVSYSGRGAELKCLPDKPIKNELMEIIPVDDDALDNFLGLCKARPGPLEPNNFYFGSNLALLITHFPLESNWLKQYLGKIFPQGNLSPTGITGWLGKMREYNEEHKSAPITTELEYLEILLDYANATHVHEIMKGNEVQAEREVKLIEEKAKNPNGAVITSVKFNPELAGKIAAKLGSKYDAHVMMDSKHEEENQKNIYIHTRLYNWVRSLWTEKGLPAAGIVQAISKNTFIGLLNGSLPEPKIAKTSVVEMVTAILEGTLWHGDVPAGQREKVFRALKQTVETLPVEQVREALEDGCILREHLGRTLDSKIPVPEEGEILPPARKWTYWEYLFRHVKQAARDCDYKLKECGIDPENLSRQLSDESSKGKRSAPAEDTSSHRGRKMPNKGFSGMMPEPSPTHQEVKQKPWPEKLDTLSELVQAKMAGHNVAVSKIADALKGCFLPSKQYDELKRAENTANQNKETTKLRLDPWQEKLVETTVDSRSAIVVRPTSGGKTLVSMVALEKLFAKDKVKDKTLLYVAPNFYQALQAYTNMVKTFPKKTFGLLTKVATIVPPDCKYWVGTPAESWSFSCSAGKVYDIMIMDEIHTMTHHPSQTPEDKGTADALCKLVSLTKQQILGLSATIHPEDEKKLSEFLTDILHQAGTNIKIETGFGDKEGKRPIPLVSKVFTGRDILPLQGNLPPTTVEVSPANTFFLLKKLTASNMTPSLIFDLKEHLSYTMFADLVKYIRDRHDQEYATWNALFTKYADRVARLNVSIGGIAPSEAGGVEIVRSRGGRGDEDAVSTEQVTKASNNYRTLLKERKELLTAVREDILAAVASKLNLSREEKVAAPPKSKRKEKKEAEVIKFDFPIVRKRATYKGAEPARKEVPIVAASVVGETVPLSSIDKDTLGLAFPEGTFPEILVEGRTRPEKVFPAAVTYEVIDLLTELRAINSQLRDQYLIEVFPVCDKVGSYFRFGPVSGRRNIFHQMASGVCLTNDTKSAFEDILAITEAESVREEDVKEIFKLMGTALSFGIGVLAPTMPFAAQFQVLNLLTSGEISIVFASESMSMGVNFPARSCVLRSVTNVRANVGKVLQMAGRAGRRGKTTDSAAYSIYWNIANAEEMTPDNMPRLELEIANTMEPGILLTGHKQLAKKLNDIRLEAGNLVRVTEAAKKLKASSVKEGAPELNMEDKNEEFEDRPEETKVAQVTAPTTVAFISDSSVCNSITKFTRVIATALGMPEKTIERVIRRIEYICQGVEDSEMLLAPYEWAEVINGIKYALQELHTVLHRCSHLELLKYMALIHYFIHRISMRYVGLVYRKDSKRLDG